jgi:hypothetical protein
MHKECSIFWQILVLIKTLSLCRLEGGVKEAVIDFQTDAAAKTALLLTNALIVDRYAALLPSTRRHNIFHFIYLSLSKSSGK